MAAAMIPAGRAFRDGSRTHIAKNLGSTLDLGTQ
jgi:hypothetical protein